MEVLLVDELLWDVDDLDFDILGIVGWCFEVVVADVVGDEVAICGATDQAGVWGHW